MRIVNISTNHVNLELYAGAIKDWCTFKTATAQCRQDRADLIWLKNESKEADKSRTQSIFNLLQLPAVVLNLGVYNMDNELNLRANIGKVATLCFYHLRSSRHLRFVLTSSLMQRHNSTLMTSRIDFMQLGPVQSTVLYCQPANALAPLQRNQYAVIVIM